MHRACIENALPICVFCRLLLSCTVPRTIINLLVVPPNHPPRATRNNIDIDIEIKSL